jgi:predicted secreted Zn-dependent protease
VTVTIERKTFLVQGCTERELIDSAIKNVPFKPVDRTVAVTASGFSIESSFVRKGSSCALASATIVVPIVVHIAEATTREGMSSDEGKKWDSFVSESKTHEQRHVDINLQGAKRLPQAIEEVPASTSCADVEESIRAAFDRITAETSRQHDAFDTQERQKHQLTH